METQTAALTARELVDIFGHTLEVARVPFKTGTYNTQDPTEFRKATVFISFDFDPFAVVDETDPSWTPPPATYEVRYSDVTWGTELKVYDPAGKLFIECYADPTRLARGNCDQLMKFIITALLRGEFSATRPVEEEPELEDAPPTVDDEVYRVPAEAGPEDA